MEDYITVSAKTLDDAITEALVQLGVTSDRLDYIVVEKGSEGFLGIGRKQAVIKARRKREEKPVEETVEESKVETPVKEEVKPEKKTEKKPAKEHSHTKKNVREEKPEVKSEPKKEVELAKVEPQTIETWEKVQKEFVRRKAMGRKYSGNSVFATKIVCGDCGAFLW